MGVKLSALPQMLARYARCPKKDCLRETAYPLSADCVSRYSLVSLRLISQTLLIFPPIKLFHKGDMELEGLEAKAKASGASQLVVKDLKEEFVKDFIFPCLRAGAIYERKYLLGTSMARPVIAKAFIYPSLL